MTPEPDLKDRDALARAAEAVERQRGNLFALEVAFLAVIGLVVLVAFIQALGYKMVSARTPFVIMVPLGLLIVVHARRLWNAREDFAPGRRIARTLRLQNSDANAVLGISAWMVGMVVMILALGHLAGIFLFCVILMRALAGERWGLTLVVASATLLFVFGVFEYAFNVELYRGLILRYFLGFNDF